MKEVYKGSQLVWRSTPPVQPFVLYESNVINRGFKQGYNDSGYGVVINSSYMSLHSVNGKTNTIVSSVPYDLSQFNELAVDLSASSTDGGGLYSGITADNNQMGRYTSDNYFETGPFGLKEMTFDISSLSGMQFIKIFVLKYGSMDGIIDIYKITLR